MHAYFVKKKKKKKRIVNLTETRKCECFRIKSFSSIRCLDWLVKIIRCMKEKKMKILSFFYDVDPFDV